jgi:hypothetical protein
VDLLPDIAFNKGRNISRRNAGECRCFQPNP